MQLLQTPLGELARRALLADLDAMLDTPRLIAMLGKAAALRPIGRSGVARLVEQGARLAEDAGRLSLNTRSLSDLMREADFHARRKGLAATGRAEVEDALAARERRCNRYPTRVRESILEGTTLISTDGERPGQINGLVVVDATGRPVGALNIHDLLRARVV